MSVHIKNTPQKSERAFSDRPQGTSKKQQTSANLQKVTNFQSYDSLPNVRNHHGLYSKTFRNLSNKNKGSTPFLKTSEQLREQNSTLKLKIHNLSSAFGKERVRKEIGVKNIKRLEEKINTQFSQEILLENLPNKSHLVQGVKYQYYKLKEQHDQKCNQINQILKQATITPIVELRIYAEALETQNKLLKERVGRMLNTEETFFKELQAQQCMEIAEDGGVQATSEWKRQQQQNMIQLLGVGSKMAMLEQRAKDLTSNMERMRQKIDIQRQLLRQRKHKIYYLQGIVKHKSNQIHLMKIQSQRELKEKDDIIKRLNMSIQEQEQRHKQAILTIANKYKRKMGTQKDIFQRYLKQAQLEAESLRKEHKRLSLIISSINNNARQQNTANIHPKQTSMLSQAQSYPIYYQSKDKFMLTFQKQLNLQQNMKQDEQQQVIQSEQGKSKQHPQSQREVKRSFVKHCNYCVKVRPIHMSEIQYIKRQLRYRLIFYGIQIDRAKEFFSLKSEQIMPLSKDEQDWVSTYISLKQIKDKLMKHPFNLVEEQANLLSRYIVEDNTKDEVYYHMENQVERVVAKSIFRAFVADYQLPHENEARREVSTLLSKKGKNLLSVLYSYAPKGFISEEKLRQICQRIQLKFAESSWVFLISRLHSKSKNLLQLDYKQILTYF